MISKYNIFKVVHSPHVSEKSNMLFKKHDIIILKVSINSTKQDIKLAVQQLFSISVRSVNTVFVKGKIKKKGKYNTRRKNWKKAYIRLQKGQNLNVINNII
ncbi:50S ribosomal protein L23 [Buchnera aphidicola]|uniref:50S ribosomal protein L23 n=1 Tax=Buchnera aphidicola TaxID=9 RepID=UPI003463FEE2